MPRIYVLGSANIDLVFALSRLPRAGETLRGGDLAIYPGGKGANQACAAGRLGGRVSIIARVGDDPFGERLLDSLRDAGVDVQRVRKVNRPTGCASIYVLKTGENSIVISAGANAAVDPSTVISDLEDITENDLLLAQLEVPIETVTSAFRFARGCGAVTILDPAPARPIPSALMQSTSYITPNQIEAAFLLDDPSMRIKTFEQAESAARRLCDRGPHAALMKLGRLGCVLVDAAGASRANGVRVDAIDSTAAGDVFNGAFAVGLAEQLPPAAVLRFANTAAAISVTRRGAQSSIPTRPEVDEMLSARAVGTV